MRQLGWAVLPLTTTTTTTSNISGGAGRPLHFMASSSTPGNAARQTRTEYPSRDRSVSYARGRRPRPPWATPRPPLSSASAFTPPRPAQLPHPQRHRRDRSPPSTPATASQTTSLLSLTDLEHQLRTDPCAWRSGVVVAVLPYGFMVDIGAVRAGLVPRREFPAQFCADSGSSSATTPTLGATVSVRLLSVDCERQRFALSMRAPPQWLLRRVSHRAKPDGIASYGKALLERPAWGHIPWHEAETAVDDGDGVMAGDDGPPSSPSWTTRP
ncbi:hypothetical protein CDCA_CDCA01G0185 [Cyanidium caldarium]|uniref:S1 motif domain-containing protein n=1 Tax=Cyanidium caldarium TaxID=2771 RepID=A0AAV9IPY6_CYACA|nr:hypothetical protein CDCA_CDCA01G0185 [Cyanidium caldarium]